MTKKIKKKQKISKMTVDEKELKSTTIPDPAVTIGMAAIGINRIQPIDIPKYLIMHPALPRGIEIKANRMIVLVDDDLKSNIILNDTDEKLLREGAKIENIKDVRIEAQQYCKKILDDSGGPLLLKKMATGAYRFGTSFVVLQTNKGENKVLRMEYQHEIFFGAARYPLQQKGENVNWGTMPMSERKELTGQMKIDRKTKKIAKYSQWTYKYPQSYADNYKTASATFVDTYTNPKLKNVGSGPLVQVGREYDQSEVMQLFFDSIGDEPLGISLVQYLHLTIKYLLNMERGCAQTQVNFGFNKWVAETPFKDEGKMKTFGKSISKVNVDAIVVLPEGIKLTNIMPGQTEFDRVHPIYMRLIAIRLGIPMPLITQDGTCYTEDTETLTDKGWKSWWEITEEDMIMAYDKDNNKLFFEKPSDFMLYPYEGKVYEFDNKCTNFCVTPNHNVLMRTYSNNSVYKTVRADQIENEYITVKTNGQFVDENNEEIITLPSSIPHTNSIYKEIPEQKFESKELMKLLGWYFSEGCVVYGQVRITQKEGNNCDEIRDILNNLNLDFNEIKDNRDIIPIIDFRIKNITLAKFLYNFGKRSFEKFLPEIIKNRNVSEIKLFLDTFCKGDGHINKVGHKSYSSSSKKLIDDLQYLVFKCGFKSKISESVDTRYNGQQKMFSLSVHKNLKGETILIKDENVIEKDYKGQVYCFETSVGFFVTRRNGKIAIQGNSTNKSTIVEQRKDMYDDFKADELTIERSVNDGFFKSCKVKYPDYSTAQLDAIVPYFRFNLPPEDKDVVMERDLQFSLMIRNFASASKAFAESGNIGVLESIGKKTEQLLHASMDLEFDPKKVKVEITKIDQEDNSSDDEKDIDQQTDDLKKKKDDE